MKIKTYVKIGNNVKSRLFWLIRALASFINRLHRLCDSRLILPDRVTYIKHKTLVQSQIFVWTASQMVDRPYPTDGAMSGVCWVFSRTPVNRA